jgi:tetratricopeptide (TPR) repeat protein
MSDYAARAVNAEALSHSALRQHEDAVLAFRAAQSVFEAHGLWANYVGAVNGSATSLTLLGRTDEARRDYARALRRYSSREHRSWIGYLQVGLAETLFSSGRYVEAAAASRRAAGTFGDTGLGIQRWLTLLLEIDCWARYGNPDQALARLEAFRKEMQDHGPAESSLRKLARAVTGANSDFEKLSRLRKQIGESLSRTVGARRA